MTEETALNISSVQHFSIGDGPGIRTTVFFKGCNLRCPWCHNPETWSDAPQEVTFEQVRRPIRFGQMRTVPELMRDILEDADFYAESGGGVTLSGGEAMLQPYGVRALARALQEENISVYIDTAGDVPWDSFEMVDAFADGYLYDLKTCDREQMKRVTGGDLDRIVENLSRLLRRKRTVRVRVPLIPGFNADLGTARKMCGLLQEIGAGTVDLLPFHRLGYEKYLALNIDYPMKDISPLTDEGTAAIAGVFAQHFDTAIEQ